MPFRKYTKYTLTLGVKSITQSISDTNLMISKTWLNHKDFVQSPSG